MTAPDPRSATNPLFNDNRLKLGTFGTNVSNGCAITTVPERLVMNWPNTLAIAQAADQKLAQLAPQLEKRLGRFEEMSNRIEQRISIAEKTVVERMRTEAPKVLDAYAQQKIAQIQREAEKIERSLSKK